MKETTREHFALKGKAIKRPFENELLKDIWAEQKEEGDEEGAKETLKIYKSLKQDYEAKMEAW